MNDGLILSIFFANAVLLGMAGWHDFQYRSVPLVLLLALNALPLFCFVTHFDWTFDKSAWFVIYFFLIFLTATLVKLVGTADTVIVVAISLLILSVDARHRDTFLMTFILWSSIAVVLWSLWRIVKSLWLYGKPKNIWDIIALKMGRFEKEPKLSQYLHNQLHGNDFNGFINHLEVFRTPDGYHLYRDSCPLVTCFWIGYLASLTSFR